MGDTHDTQAVPTKLLWVDLEMTGLDPATDVILEVAAEITDFSFTTLARYEARVQQPRDVVLARMQRNAWWQAYPHNRDDFIAHLPTAVPSQHVEAALVALVGQHFGTEPAILAGNSIYNDRNFIKQWWPALDAALHYRMLDVSAFKIVMQGAYGVVFEKRDVHRAQDDIQASIAELRYYLDWLRDNG